jgi:hypothetical protein
MLHLMLVGSDLACASHGARSGRAMAGMSAGAHMTMGDMDGHAGAAHASAQPATDCTTPAQTRCCDAMSSCGVSTTLGAAPTLALAGLPEATTPRHLGSVLVSVRTAPEPPPPKA